MFDRALLNQLYRYCVALCDDTTTANDLLQISVTKALNNPPADTVTLAWLRRVAKNSYIDQYRHQQRLYHTPYDDEAPVELDLNALENLVIDSDELDYYWRQMTTDERELLFLWAVEGYTAAELAEQLSLPRGTVLARLHRTKQRLRAIAEEQCA